MTRSVLSGCSADLRCSDGQMLELCDMEGVYFNVDWMTRCVTGEQQVGESTGISVLMCVPVLDTVPVSGKEQGNTVADERQSWQVDASQG